MLTIKNVSRRYGRTLANDDLSFSVEPGQITVLLGPNGAGKSTIIKCIAGLLRFKGEITIDNLPNKSTDAKRLLGYIPEMPAIYELLTVKEHIEFVRRAWRTEGGGEYTERLLERLELSDKMGKLGNELSKGMQQKLSICCALAHQPRVVIFDEPLVGLDPHAIKELKLVFRELRDEGCCVLISTHMLDSMEDYWDSAHIMVNGRIAASVVNTRDGDSSDSLEKLFFEITEGSAVTGDGSAQSEEAAIDGASAVDADTPANADDAINFESSSKVDGTVDAEISVDADGTADGEGGGK